jgi:hypothetical protein
VKSGRRFTDVSEALAASIIRAMRKTLEKNLGLWLLIALMMEAASASVTSVNFYQTTRRNNSEDSHLHTHCRENLKTLTFDSYLIQAFLFVHFSVTCH